jgi:Undecaprenyl-phosphate glucose phosphotransferase
MLANKKSLQYLRLFLDLILLNISFIAAAVLAQSFEILIQKTHMFVLLVGLNFLWYYVSNVLNFYEDYSIKYFIYQFTNILKIVVIQVLASLLFVFFVKELLFTRNFIILYAVFLSVLVSFRVQLIRYLLIKIRGREKNLKNVLIVGAGETGRNFQQMLNEHNDFGYNTVGFIDNHEISENVIGTINDIDKLIIERNIEVVVVALSFSESSWLDEIIKICNKRAVRTYIIPDYFNFTSKKFQISMLGDFPIIAVRDEPLSEAHWKFIKRVMDIILSFLITILVLSWFIPLIFIINKINSSGTLFFTQDRVGADDKVFKCYKFRTMRSSNNKEDYEPAVVNDPRVTKTGKLLRKTNLDELPQFVNVFKGEMSIVGPRPHPVAFDNVYKEMVNELRIRNWVRPGLTGWAQIHGLRGDIPDKEENKKRIAKRVEFDLWYIENWSIWLDIQIMLLTIWQILRGNAKGT